MAMKVRQSVRVSPLLEGMTGVEIREAAEYAIANGWKAGEPVGLLVDNVLKCISDLEVVIEGKLYSCWVAPCEENSYEHTVFIGSVEDGEREPLGMLKDMLDDLRVLRYF